MKIEVLTIKKLQDGFCSVELKCNGIGIEFEDEIKNLSFLEDFDRLIQYVIKRLTEIG